MRYLILAAVSALIVTAEKPIGPAASEDETVLLEASAYIDKAAVAKVLGQDLGMELIVIEVKLAPRGDTKVQVNLDDFTLISRKDGQRSQPLAPSQIAGAGALIVVPGGRGGGGGGLINNGRGPIWGGMPGTGTRPSRVGGDGEAGAIGAPSATRATVNTGSKTSENPILDLLKEKVLPQKETNETVTGLLYFFLEGKHKLKQLELMYKSPASRLMLDFER